jgi:acyl carrier protein
MSWLTSIVLLIAVIAVAAVLMGRWESRAKRRKLEEAFRGRRPLDERTFYETYFQSRGVPPAVVSRVRKILEEELEADLSRLSSKDDFQKNLSFFWQCDSMADVEVVVRLEEEFGITITDAEAGKTSTVEDLVNLVWLKLGRRAA